MKTLPSCLLITALALATVGVRGESAAPAGPYVTREEYNQLLKELAVVKAQLHALQTGAANQQSENDETFNDYDKQLRGLNAQVDKVSAGSTKMLLTGYAAATFRGSTRGFGPAQPLDEIGDDPRPGKSVFTVDFSPILLWQVNDRALFESELETGIGPGGASDISLGYAQLSYVLNDYLTVGAGKFLNPTNFFIERLHPFWIDKMPDRPLAVFDGLMPESVLGAEIRGAAPLGPTKFEYAFYVGNSPTLKTPDNDRQRGLMGFDDLSMTHLSPGGRVGFFPVPNLEVGYGLQKPNLENGVGGLLQSVDLNYQADLRPIKGTVDLKAQWMWSRLDPDTVDPATGDTVPLPAGMNNHRDGGYAQLAYRPSLADGPVKKAEFVIRYDELNQRHTPVGFDEHRWALGLDYWMTADSVVKTAYEFDRQNGTGQDGEDLLLQYALAF